MQCGTDEMDVAETEHDYKSPLLSHVISPDV
jgi:hypothetical protein